MLSFISKEAMLKANVWEWSDLDTLETRTFKLKIPKLKCHEEIMNPYKLKENPMENCQL